ncbi:MAG: hypothetical protein KBD07_04630, partial [Candidatus Omnitrophica bacterium]|nr:hypothetical protein [Candidatus Omnitrophota bacterium]
MEKHRRNNLRPIAIAVILAFTAEQAAMAAPALPTIVPASLKPAINFRLPESVAVVDDSYKAPGDSKLLILIQDAHTNDSGQMNVARALDEILPKEDINTVFTEADSGDVSVGYMKPFFDKKVRQDVARKLVRKGEMRGHDYANLVGDRDFTLWGVEDPALYLETLKTYQGLVERRDRVRAYLDRVQRSVETLKNDFFAQDLKNLDALRAKHNSGDRSLADYSEDLLKAADAAGFDASRYANIKYLRKLRNLEKKIDFKAASSEEREAMKTLPQADREELLAVHKKKGPQAAAGEDGFYALFADKLNGRDASFPNLRKYFDYLKEMRRMNALGVVGEIHEFEEQLFLTMAKTRDEAVLWVFGRNLEMLQDLIALKVSPEDFNRIRSDKSLFDMRLITGFLNRKIADLDLHYENAVTLEASYDAAREDAFHFYDLTLSRDRVFMDQVVSKMEKDQINKAVLITGGYHSPNLKAMLRGAGYSYVSLLPQVLAETDTARYEKLLLSQIKGLDADNSENTRVASNGRTSSKEAAMNQAMGPAELVGELVSGARLGIVPAELSQRISVRGSLSNDARPTAGDGARMASDEDSVITPTIVEIRISESVRLDKKRFSIGLDVDRTANGDYELVLSLDDKDPDLDYFVDDVRLDVDEAAHRPDNTQQYLRSPIGPGATNYHIPIVVKKAFGGVLGTIYVQLTGLADVNTFEGKGGAEGPYHVTIQANWVPIISEGARLAELTQERTTKLEAMAANKWKPEVVPTVKDWYASPFVSVEQRAALDKLIDDGKADQIEAGFDSPTGVLMPGTAGVRSKLENLAEGKVGPNYFSRTTVMQYVEAHIRWYKETSQTGQALITREVRDGSDEYADLAVRMLLAAGIPVTVVSRPVSTPFASFLSHWFGKLKQLVNKYAATIIVSTVFTLQLSASHNTFLDNGIKIMGSAGEQLMPEALQEITSRTPKLSETNVTSPHEGSLQEFVESGLYSDLSFEEELDAEEAYFDAIDQTMEEGYAGVLASAREKGFKFVYTAFNGASGPATQRLLGRLGYVEDRDYYLVKDEASGIDEITPLSDPGLGDQANQSARARSTSDPLGKNNLNAAQAIADKHNVPVVFAHDPDGDRLVVSIKVNGKWRTLSGNDNSVLMLHDRLSNGVMPDDDYMIVRSHATTRLIDFIAAKFNRKVIVTGVGFKYIAALILSLRQRVGVIGRRFLGMEESGGTSHGHVAEKDGMSGLIQMLIVASRAHAQESGAAKDLADALLEIAYEFGVLGDDITSLEFGDKTTTAPQINARREAVKTGLEGLEDGSSLGALTITGPLKKSVKVDELDGLEVHDGYDMIVTDQEGVQWRVLIRFSGTEPKSKFMISLVEPRQLSEKSHEALAALNQELKTKTEAIGQELSGVIGAMALNAEAPVASTPGQGATPEDSYHAEAPNTNPGMVDQYVKMAQESGVGEEAIRTRLRQINALIAPANFTTRENVEPAIALHRIVWASIYADSNPESDAAKAVRAQSYLNLEAIFDRQLPSSFDSAVASMIGSDQAGPAGVLLNQVQAGFFGMPTTTDAQRVVFLAAVLNGDRSQTQQVLQGAGLSDLAERFSQSAVEATVESSVSTDRGATARDWGEPDAFSTTVDFSGSQQGLSNIHLDVRFADGNLYVTLDEADEDADFGGPRVTKPTSTVSRLEEETSDVNFHAPNFLFKRTVTVVHSDDRTVVNGVVTIEMRRLKPGPFVLDETFELLFRFDGLE